MSTWLARWRVALRIARRDAWRHKGRTALVVAMVALPLLAGTAVISLIRSSMPTPAVEVPAVLGPSAQAEVSDAGCRPYYQDPTGRSGGCSGDGSEVTTIDEVALERVLGVDDVAPRWHIWVDPVSDSAAIDDQVIGETERAETLAAIAEAQAGRLPSQAGEIALATNLARRLDVTVGDSMTLQNELGSVDVDIVGLMHPRSRDVGVVLSGTLPAEWRSSEAWLVLGDAPVTWDQVLAGNEEGWQVFSRAVALDPPPLSQTPFGLMFGGSPAASAQTVGLVGAVLAMGLLEIGLLIGPAFAVGAKRNQRQLALAAAAGGAPADLRRIVLASGVVSGVLAAVVGLGLGLGLTAIGVALVNRFVDSGYLPLVLPTWELAAMALVAVLLGVGAAWLPARSAARRDVTEALAGRRGDPRPARGIGRLGLALAVLGGLGMLLGALTGEPVGLVAGVVVLEIGVVLASGTIVTVVGRLAPRLGVAGRFALRDSVRHRSRTAPAVAAVLAAVAAASAGAIYLDGQSAANRGSWTPLADSPALVLLWGDDDLTTSSEQVDAALDAVGQKTDVTAAVPVQAGLVGLDPETGDAIEPTIRGVYDAWVIAEADPMLDCGATPPDPRCETSQGSTSGLTWPGTIIDDGTLLEAAGLPGWEEAAAMLHAGGVVVERGSLWADGTAALEVVSPTGPSGATGTFPAYGTSWRALAYSVVLSPQAAAELGLVPEVVGALITMPAELPQQEVDQLNGLVRAESSALTLTADRMRPQGFPLALALVAIAIVVALIAVGLAVGLAGADTAPDMATLSAIGAPPRVRRRVAAAQAGVIAGTGAVLGVLTGILIGLVLSLWGREQSGYGDSWPLAVPWPVPLAAVLVPLVTMACTWLLTRSRLPLVRRIAE